MGGLGRPGPRGDAEPAKYGHAIAVGGAGDELGCTEPGGKTRGKKSIKHGAIRGGTGDQNGDDSDSGAIAVQQSGSRA
jgi:hypothetical protein